MSRAERVAVRPAEHSDLPAVADIYNHFVLNSAATFDVEPVTVEQRRQWFTHYADHGPHRLLVADVDEKVCGYATSSVFRDRPAYATSVETSVYCDPSCVGRGLGSALYRELFRLLEREDLHRAYAGIALPNAASEALHRRLGFREVGTYREVGRKLGRWWDVRWYERELS